MGIDLSNVLQSQLGGILDKFLSNQGETAESSGQASKLAIPAIIAGLVKHIASNPSNLSGVFDLINGEAGSQLTGSVERAGENSNLDDLMNVGKKLLPDLLGGNGANVADQISKESGISKVSAGSLLSLALPLVLSVLRGHSQSNHLNQSQLLGLLGQQQGWLSKVLNTNMLSALGIGSLGGVFGSLSNLASSFGTTGTPAQAGTAKKSSLGKWIAIIIIILALLALFKSCSHHDNVEPNAGVAVASAVSAPSNDHATVEAVSEVAAPTQSEATSDVSSPISEPKDVSAVSTPEVDRVSYENQVAKFFFAVGSSQIAPNAIEVVGDVIKAGKEGKHLIISGYTDSTGNAETNAQLSKKRAQAVKAFFEAQGVNAKNIELRKPKDITGADGSAEEGRRVEVTVE